MNKFSQIVRRIYETGAISLTQQEQLEQVLWELPDNDRIVQLMLNNLEEDISKGKISISTM
ncbi:MAG: hypothetical protein WBB82_08730 [Limnothrix sp.]